MKRILYFALTILFVISLYSCNRQLISENQNQSQTLDNTTEESQPPSPPNQTYNLLDLVITEINWGGSYSNDNNPTSDGEFIEIMNNTTNTINLSGFQLRYDGGGSFTNKRTTLPSIQLSPGEFLVVFISNNSHNPYDFVTNTNNYKTFIWTPSINYIANNGFRISIIDPNGQEIDFVETRIGYQGKVDLKGSSGITKKTMERNIPILPGTNNNAWSEAISNINYKYENQNNLGTPGSSNSVWFIYKNISLVAPTQNIQINKSESSTITFEWALTGTGREDYISYNIVIQKESDGSEVLSITTNSTNITINISDYNNEEYRWFIKGINIMLTNFSQTNKFIITNFSTIVLSFPTNNYIHNKANLGNTIYIAWSYTPSNAFNQAEIYILNRTNGLVANFNSSGNSFNFDVTSLESGEYKLFIVSTNTSTGLYSYSTTNVIRIYKISNINSGIFFSEINWGGMRITPGSGSHIEFIEIYNTNDYDINLNGWTISYINNSYSPSSFRNFSITNDLIIKSKSTAVIINESITSPNPLLLFDTNNIETWYQVSFGAGIANSGFVLWLWNTNGGSTNYSDNIIVTTTPTNTNIINGLQLLATPVNGGFSPKGTASSSNPAKSMVRTNFNWTNHSIAATNESFWREANKTLNIITNLNGTNNNTLSTPGIVEFE